MDQNLNPFWLPIVNKKLHFRLSSDLMAACPYETWIHLYWFHASLHFDAFNWVYVSLNYNQQLYFLSQRKLIMKSSSVYIVTSSYITIRCLYHGRYNIYILDQQQRASICLFNMEKKLIFWKINCSFGKTVLFF